LIDQLLTFSHLDAGTGAVQLAEVDATRLLEDVQGIMEPLAAKAGLALEVQAPHGLSLVTDPDPLRQILLNLVSNALEYTERGVIRLEAHAEPDRVALAVSATGVGIAPSTASGPSIRSGRSIPSGARVGPVWNSASSAVWSGS